jgi:hypothetical protein
MRKLGLIAMVAALAVAGCGVEAAAPQGNGTNTTATPTERWTPVPTPTATLLPTPAPTSTPVRGQGYLNWPMVPDHMRRDLGNGVIAAKDAFEGGLAVYVTHIESGAQVVVTPDEIYRPAGDEQGLAIIDAVLAREGVHTNVQLMLSTEPTRPQCVADLMPELRFGGLKYHPYTWLPAFAAVSQDMLGEVRYRTSFHLQCGYKHELQEGETMFLPAGTPVYEMRGYAPTFRLAAKGTGAGSGLWVYEAATSPDAQVGEDLLDIRGKVTSIDILAAQDRRDPLAIIDDPALIEELVGLVLDAPVNHDDFDNEGKRYFLAFRLADGTASVRPLYVDEARLSSIVAPERVLEIVQEVLR